MLIKFIAFVRPEQATPKQASVCVRVCHVCVCHCESMSLREGLYTHPDTGTTARPSSMSVCLCVYACVHVCDVWARSWRVLRPTNVTFRPVFRLCVCHVFARSWRVLICHISSCLHIVCVSWVRAQLAGLKAVAEQFKGQALFAYCTEGSFAEAWRYFQVLWCLWRVCTCVCVSLCVYV